MTMDKGKRVGAAVALAAAIAIPAEGLRLRNLSALSVTNEVNERIRDSGDDGKRMCRNSLMQQLANVGNLLGRKFVCWLLLAVEVYKTCLPSVLSVTRKANPLKVLGSVVRLDSIDVIDAQALFVSRNKRHCNKAMNHEPSTFSVDVKADFTVSGVVWLRCVLLWLSRASNNLFVSVANAFIGVSSCRNPNVPIVAYLKRNAALNNCCPLFHVYSSCDCNVSIIGGL
jgi:hypothetical protein